MGDIALFDGKRVSMDEAKIGALGSAAMFGNQVFERKRGFYDTEGRLRIRALKKHLARITAGIKALFGIDIADDQRAQWRRWIIDATKASEFKEPYIHLGYGQFQSPGTMLQGGASGLGTFLSVQEAAPLYGDSVALVSETEWPRPTGPLMKHKISGHYADLLYFKNRARQKQRTEKNVGVECVLFTQGSFGFFDSPAGVCGMEEDPRVAELGCSNAFAVTEEEGLILPDLQVPFFRGISVQIVEALFHEMFPEADVTYDLRLSDLRAGGATVGTATRDIVPVVSVDRVEAQLPHGMLIDLMEAYENLCHGRLPKELRHLQDEWRR